MFVLTLTDIQLKQLKADVKVIKQKLKDIAHDLNLIKTKCPVKDAVLHGGAVLSILSGRPPSDWDIYYKARNPNQAWEDIHNSIKNLHGYKVFKDKIDTYNSLDVLPWASLTDLTVGFLSDHAEYFSMFAITDRAEIITNQVAWRDFNKRIYRLNKGTLAFLGWVKSKKYSLYNFHIALGYIAIRAVYYKSKYKLSFDEETTSFFYESLAFFHHMYNSDEQVKALWDKKAQNKGFEQFIEVLADLRSIEA